MGDVLKKVPVREQDPKVRAANFDEVCLGYNQEEAMEEAARCLHCKNAKCVQGCPVNIDIPIIAIIIITLYSFINFMLHPIYIII